MFFNHPISWYKPKEIPPPPYWYTDTPEGQDIGKKLWCVIKSTLGISLAVTTVDVLCYSHSKTYLDILKRFGRISVPLLGMATVATLVTNLSTKVRGKDDTLNWTLGGISAGVILGSCKGTGVAMGNWAFVLGMFATAKKFLNMDGTYFLPPEIIGQYKCQKGNWWGAGVPDISLIKERPKNWVKESET